MTRNAPNAMFTLLRRGLAELVKLDRQWTATMVLLVWIKFMDPLKEVFEDFFLLARMVALMIGDVQALLSLMNVS